MKKVISIFLFAAIIVSLCAFTVYADSQVLTYEEQKVFGEDRSFILKYYNGMFIHAFANGVSLPDIISNSAVVETIYVFSEESRKDELYLSAIRNGIETHITVDPNLKEASVFVKYYDKGEKLLKCISVNAEVKEVYCLGGGASHDGTYIYFVTDGGDYVFYKEYPTSEDEYIIPAEKFCEMAKTISREREKNKYKDGGNPGLEELFGGSQYDLKQYKVETFTMYKGMILTAALAVVAVVVVFVAVCIIMKKRRRMQSFAAGICLQRDRRG